jgi:hypothetical protein
MERVMVCVLLAPTLAPKYSGLGVAVTAGVETECGAIVKVEPAETGVTEFKVSPVRSATFTVPSLTVQVVVVPSVSITTSVPRTPPEECPALMSKASHGSKTSESFEHRSGLGITLAHNLPPTIFMNFVTETFPISWKALIEESESVEPSGVPTTAEPFAPVVSVSSSVID